MTDQTTTQDELSRSPEFRVEQARIQAKTVVHLDSLMAAAIREAVRQDRQEVDGLLAMRLTECFCTGVGEPCDSCMEVARIRGTLAARPEL